MSRVVLYLALIALPMLTLDWLDGIVSAAALVLSFGAVDLAQWLWGEHTTAKTPRVGATRDE